MPLISDSIGKVLGNRYRLVAALGSGASAHVYLAEDVTLQRRVAVKVLQPALAREESFLKRFRAEARSVASLNHPHILRVFDWGEDGDGPYLVMEYLDGGSLRDILDRRFRLSVAQAARLGAEAAQGLAYAHARGLVHRDVKPANLLFDEEGRVRIADFGVARALAEASWTEPAGAMIGTARYASPEQAQGHGVDGRSDVYSLALVLYEGLTGSVPFVTDTTVGTLMARVGASLPRHPALGRLDDTLARAAAPEVAHRLEAAELATRLEVVAAGLDPPRALPLRRAPPEDSDTHRVAPVPVIGGPEPTVVAGGSRAETPSATEHQEIPEPIVVPWPLTGVVPVDEQAIGQQATAVVSDRAGAKPFDVEEVEAPLIAPEAPGPDHPGSGPPILRASHRVRRRRRWPWVVAAGVVVIVAVVIAVVISAGVFTPSHPTPRLAGTTLASSRTAVARDHFKLRVQTAVYSITVPAGWVVSQSPAAGTPLKEGSAVSVVPSRGVPNVTVPSLTGLDCTGASRVLAAAHLKAVCPVLQSYEQSIPAGQVINWSYNNHLNPTVAPYGATIGIATSQGPPPRPVPAVTVGGSYNDAAQAITNAGLVPAQTNQYSSSVPQGGVIGTSPGAGTTANYGSTVTVYVSLGPQMVKVPNLKGQSVDQATAALQKVGLSVGNVYGPSKSQTVLGTDPPEGTSVAVGSSVNLYTGSSAGIFTQ